MYHTNLHKLLVLLSSIYLVLTEGPKWNYKKHGNDWLPDYEQCDPAFGNSAPLILKSSEATKMTNEYYFFPKMNLNITGTLNLEDFNNNLVFTADESKPLGSVHYNLEDDTYYSFNCSKIYFRLPGEHVFDYTKYDMELQLNCSGALNNPSVKLEKKVFVAIPVKIVKNFKAQSSFFDTFDNAVPAQLPVKLTIPHLDDVLNPFNMYDKIFFYSGAVNYPDCSLAANWIVIENVMTITERVYNKLFDLLDKNQIDDGNYKEATPKNEYEDVYLLENQFKSS